MVEVAPQNAFKAKLHRVASGILKESIEPLSVLIHAAFLAGDQMNAAEDRQLQLEDGGLVEIPQSMFTTANDVRAESERILEKAVEDPISAALSVHLARCSLDVHTDEFKEESFAAFGPEARRTLCGLLRTLSLSPKEPSVERKESQEIIGVIHHEFSDDPDSVIFQTPLSVCDIQ